MKLKKQKVKTKRKDNTQTETRKEYCYRLAHEGSLHALLQPLASACINRPVEEAKIPAGACYQKTPLKVLHKRAKEPKLYHTGIVCYYYYYYYYYHHHNGTQWVS